MPKFLSGREIADIKEHEHTVRVLNLKDKGIIPKLAIIQTISLTVIDTYVRVKRKYAEKIGVKVEHYFATPEDIGELIVKLNTDDTVHGIIIQLPLYARLDQAVTLNMVVKSKDVDGLVLDTFFVSPTVQAIMWLLDKNIPELSKKKIALVGKGILVGAPLEKELLKRNLFSKVFTKGNALDTLSEFDVIVSATGTPNLITNNFVGINTYVLDAGTAEENGAIHGDASDELYERDDIFITPIKGGVGILTVRALFENILLACEKNLL